MTDNHTTYPSLTIRNRSDKSYNMQDERRRFASQKVSWKERRVSLVNENASLSASKEVRVRPALGQNKQGNHQKKWQF